VERRGDPMGRIAPFEGISSEEHKKKRGTPLTGAHRIWPSGPSGRPSEPFRRRPPRV